jgi:hypothetical protein
MTLMEVRTTAVILGVNQVPVAAAAAAQAVAVGLRKAAAGVKRSHLQPLTLNLRKSAVVAAVDAGAVAAVEEEGGEEGAVAGAVEVVAAAQRNRLHRPIDRPLLHPVMTAPLLLMLLQRVAVLRTNHLALLTKVQCL